MTPFDPILHDHEKRLAMLEAARRTLEDQMIVMDAMERRNADKIQDCREWLAEQTLYLAERERQQKEWQDRHDLGMNSTTSSTALSPGWTTSLSAIRRTGNDWQRHAIAAVKNLAEDLHDLLVQVAVIRQQMWRVEIVRPSAHIGYQAARFGDQQPARRHVPGLQSEFPKPVQATAGHPRQIDGGRACAAHAMRGHGKLMVEVHVHAQVAPTGGEAGAQQTAIEAADCRNADAAIVKPSTRTALRGEHLLPDRIEYHSNHHLASPLQRQRYIEDGKGMREVGGAVQRVHVPAVFRRAGMAAAFLGHDAVLRKAGLQPLDHQFFGCAVGFRDQVKLALQLERHAPLEVGGQQRAGFTRNLNGGFQVGTHCW